MLNGHKTDIHEVNVKERKKKYIITSLHPSPPITKMSYANSPPKYMTTLIPKLLPLFVMNDKG